MSPDHPTPEAKVAYFMATVEDYERLQETYPLPTRQGMSGHEGDDATRWVIVLHAMLLRKYFATTDWLELPKVAAALRQCVTGDDPPPAEWEEIIENVGQYLPTTRFGEEGLTETDILIKYLYGRYLHGDHDKWAVTLTHPQRIPDYAFWSATHSRVSRVMGLAEWIRAGVDEGWVRY